MTASRESEEEEELGGSLPCATLANDSLASFSAASARLTMSMSRAQAGWDESKKTPVSSASTLHSISTERYSGTLRRLST